MRSSIGLTMLAALTMVMVGAGVSRAQDFVFVILNTNPHRPELPKATVDSLQQLHMSNINRLANEGHLLAAGPFHGGGGIFVFRPTTVDSVDRWLQTDAAIRAGRFVLERFRYRPEVGSICSVGETFEMTSYSFIRLRPDTSKGGVPTVPTGLVKQVLTSLAPTDTLIAAGEFVGGFGGILVLRNVVPDDHLKSVSGVRDAQAIGQVRKLWIARGAFCEQ